MLRVHALPAFVDNYIWLIEDGQGHAMVVDPGTADPVITALHEHQLTLAAILVTHHHQDHTGGIAELRACFPDVEVLGPTDSPASGHITHPLHDGAVIDVLGARADVLAVPGHTLDHIAYFIGSDATMQPLLFSGDLLFGCGCGRVFEGTLPMMHASLQRVAALPPETRVFCAHEYTLGNIEFALAVEPQNAELLQRAANDRARRARGEATVPSTLALELATNPFLRSHCDAVRSAARTHSGQDPADDAAVFAVIRSWKDVFP